MWNPLLVISDVPSDTHIFPTFQLEWKWPSWASQKQSISANLWTSLHHVIHNYLQLCVFITMILFWLPLFCLLKSKIVPNSKWTMTSVEEISSASPRPSVSTNESDQKLLWMMSSVGCKIVNMAPTEICGEESCDCMFHHACQCKCKLQYKIDFHNGDPSKSCYDAEENAASVIIHIMKLFFQPQKVQLLL